MKRLYAISICSFLLGCSTPQIHPGGTTIPQAIQHLQDDISHIGAIAVTDSSHWSREQNEEFTRSVRSLQCQQQKADPVIVMMMGQVDVMLTGSYNVEGRFSIGTGSGIIPSVHGGGMIDKGIGQGITLPLHFISLSQVPNRVLLYHLKLLKETYFLSPSLNLQKDEELSTEYWNNRDSLVNRVTLLESTWTPLICGNFQHTVKPFFGTRVQK